MLKTGMMSIVALLGVYLANAQGYQITVQIDELQDSTILLAVHSGNNKYARDTAKTDKRGYAVFAKNTPLAGGMYILVAGNTQLCEFLISDEQSQQFTIRYKKNDDAPVEVSFKNSPENTAFVEFQKFMGKRQNDARRLREQAQKDSMFRTAAVDSMKHIANEEKEYTDGVINKWKGKLLATLARSVQPAPPAPELDIPDDHPQRDSIRWVHYYQWEKNHFFDHLDLTDARLLNTPVFQPNFDTYFNTKIAQHPDTVIAAVHRILDKTKGSDDMFMYCLGHLFNTYIQWKTLTITPDYAIGMEAVVIDLITHYYLAGKAPWAEKDTTFMRQIREYVRFNRHSLVGLPAHDLQMQQLTGQYTSLYSVQAPYTLLIFFDTNCGHCQKEIPLIYDTYKQFREKGLQVFCVYIGRDGPAWQKFVEERELDWINTWDPYETTNFREIYTVQTTPQIYLLNKDKKIIARRVTHDLLEQLLPFYIDKKAINSPEE
ncbi:MAG: redoxin domain-containing protein [Prevotellaceae bacterium]|jgi:peroxiredoxin|nr:redoxin domain-containing protein [Prevotellaceae bacterium]